MSNQASKEVAGPTPGPWRFAWPDDGMGSGVPAPNVFDGESRVVASVESGWHLHSLATYDVTSPPEEFPRSAQEANAALIAAAPDLLAALEGLMDEETGHTHACQHHRSLGARTCWAACEIARAAIAKARSPLESNSGSTVPAQGSEK